MASATSPLLSSSVPFNQRDEKTHHSPLLLWEVDEFSNQEVPSTLMSHSVS